MEMFNSTETRVAEHMLKQFAILEGNEDNCKLDKKRRSNSCRITGTAL